MDLSPEDSNSHYSLKQESKNKSKIFISNQDFWLLQQCNWSLHSLEYDAMSLGDWCSTFGECKCHLKVLNVQCHSSSHTQLLPKRSTTMYRILGISQPVTKRHIPEEKAHTHVQQILSTWLLSHSIYTGSYK